MTTSKFESLREAIEKNIDAWFYIREMRADFRHPTAECGYILIKTKQINIFSETRIYAVPCGAKMTRNGWEPTNPSISTSESQRAVSKILVAQKIQVMLSLYF